MIYRLFIGGGRNLCLICRHYYNGKCCKEPYHYCLITRST